MPLNSLNIASSIQVRIGQVIEEREKINQESILTVGAVLLIFSILTIAYSITGKRAVLYGDAGVTFPLRDNFKNTSQISHRGVLVLLTLPFWPCLGTTFIPSSAQCKDEYECHIIHTENKAQRSSVTQFTHCPKGSGPSPNPLSLWTFLSTLCIPNCRSPQKITRLKTELYNYQHLSNEQKSKYSLIKIFWDICLSCAFQCHTFFALSCVPC